MQGFTAFLCAVTLALPAATAAASEAKIIAQTTFDTVDGDQRVSANVSLKDDGQLAIATTNLAAGPTATPFVTTVELGNAAFAILKNQVQELSTAEITTTHSVIVCEMIAFFGSEKHLSVRRGYDYQTQEFSGAIAVVDNYAGCANPTKIAPKEAYDVEIASELQTALQVLALQAIHN